MLVRVLAASLLLVSSPAIPQVDIHRQPPVPKVVCRAATGYVMGSAFRVGPQYLITAAHVSNNPHCQIDGQDIHIVYTSRKLDFAILEDDRAGSSIPVDCGGFKVGHKYYAVGHARGADDLFAIPMFETGLTEDGMAVLAGIEEAQPGQSGGPIVDPETMKVVGVVNAADWETGKTYSVELKGTSICGGTLA
jgi:hypothetical protein